jgi:hypothetical protein
MINLDHVVAVEWTARGTLRVVFDVEWTQDGGYLAPMEEILHGPEARGLWAYCAALAPGVVPEVEEGVEPEDGAR